MVELKMVARGVVPNADFIIDRFSKYEKMSYLFTYPKIVGEWNISISNLKYEEAVKVIEDCKDLAYVKAILYLDKAVLKQLEVELRMHSETSSLKTTVEALLQQSDFTASDNIIFNIIRRCRGDLDDIKELINNLSKVGTGRLITLKDLNKVSIANQQVYSMDLIEQAFGVSRYPADLGKLVDKHYEYLSPEIAYFSIRKVLKKLLSDKVEYLKGNSVTNFDFHYKVPANDLVYAYSLICKSNKEELLSCLYQIQNRRNKN